MANEYKSTFLGMNYSTANHRLRKAILFQLVQETDRDVCFHCNHLITDIAEFSIEHKKPWLHIDSALFWDLSNIAFSHLRCNIRAARHGHQKPPILKGEDSPTSILIEKEVLEIRARYKAGGESYATLAKEYNVGRSTIGDIIHRRRWKHI